MREITTHAINELNEALKLTVLDAPGAGGACHKYQITLGDKIWNIDFQNGPIGEAGLNGISGEVLLAVLIDRLQHFQSGAYANRDNAIALTHLEDALMRLQKRTRERVARGVEGTHKI